MSNKYDKVSNNMPSTIFVSITNRCNLNCRHCTVVPMSDRFASSDANREDMIDWIKQIARAKDDKSISFLGGEPLLCLDDLKYYIGCAKDNGLSTSIVTNGHMARTPEAAEELLDELSGLDCIFVSTDKYHLEFIEKETVYNLIDACIRRNIQVGINITAASREEGVEVSRIYGMRYFKEILARRINLTVSQMFKNDPPQDFEIEEFNYAENLNLLSNFCTVKNHTILLNGTFHLCCGGSRFQDVYKSPFSLGNLYYDSYESIMKRREESLVYRFMRDKGPAGLARIIMTSPLSDDFKKATFSNQCDMCFWAFSDDAFCDHFYCKAMENTCY